MVAFSQNSFECSSRHGFFRVELTLPDFSKLISNDIVGHNHYNLLKASNISHYLKTMFGWWNKIR